MLRTTLPAISCFLSLATIACQPQDEIPPEEDRGQAGAGDESEVVADKSTGPGPDITVMSGSDEDLPWRMALAQERKKDGKYETTTWPQVGGGIGPDFDLSVYEAGAPDDTEVSLELGKEEAVTASDEEDGVAVTRQALTASATTVHTRDTGWGAPHEPTVSLGKAQMLVATRAGLSIMSKSNRLIYESDAAGFFGVFARPEELFDCRAVYAPAQQRHVFICIQNWMEPGGGQCPGLEEVAGACKGQIMLAISKTPYPTRPSDFWIYVVPVPDMDNNSSTRNELDFPYLGVTNDALIITSLVRRGIPGAVKEAGKFPWFWNDFIQVLKLDDLAAGVLPRKWMWSGDALMVNDAYVAGIVPAVHSGATNRVFMVSHKPGSNTSMLMWMIDNPFDASRTLQWATVSGLAAQNSACSNHHCRELQMDDNTADAVTPPALLMHHDGFFRTPAWRNNRLYYVRDQTHVYSGIRKGVIRFGTINSTTGTSISDRMLGSAGAAYGWPGIGTTSGNDALLGWVHTSASNFPNVRAVSIDENDALGDMIVPHTASTFYGRLTGLHDVAGYDVGVSVAAEPAEDAAWMVTQTPIHRPAHDHDWNAGLVMIKVGGVKKFDLTVPRYIHATAGDLAQTAISNVSSVTRGRTLSSTVRIENFGDLASPANVHVSMYLSTDTLINSNDTYIGAALLPSVPTGQAGSFTTLNVSGTVPTNMAPGNYRIGFIIIVNVNEYETTNNTGWNDAITRVL